MSEQDPTDWLDTVIGLCIVGLSVWAIYIVMGQLCE
jgi:hypothetical protein